MMRALGAEVVIVEQCAGSLVGQVSGADLERVFAAAEAITAERDAYRADQFGLGGNARAHYLHTGPELLRQAAGSGLTIDGFVDFVGSGGTFAGVASALREARSPASVDCYIVEPAGADVLSGATPSDEQQAPHAIQGGGYSMSALAMLAEDHCAPPDGYLTVTSEEAAATARLLARLEGVFGGFSGGANVHAAAQLLRGPLGGGVVACVICDSGLKYLSTELWEP